METNVISLQNSKLSAQKSESSYLTKSRKQLNALTSLRFFACAAIIFFHSAWYFFDITFIENWQLDEGVAFFFVLSGFILTYVYPHLQSKDSIKHFLVNRLGRMVPSQVLFTLVTLIALPCSCASIGVLLANLFCIQSWIPRREYYFGLDAPSWSISAEIFFSFAFILLIRPWKGGWIGKIALGIFITSIACIWSHLFLTSGSHGFFKFNDEYLLKINPLVRCADFILGMATAKLWMRYHAKIKLDKWTASLIEIVLVSIVIFEVTQVNYLVKNFFPLLKQYPSFFYWLVHGGCAPIFCALIFIMALNFGFISQLLNNKILVWLGEISFSMYMIHFILIQCLNFYLPEFGQINWLITYPIYLAMLVLLSYLNFNLVENPFRNLTKTLVFSFKNYHFSASNILSHFAFKRHSIITAALLSIALATAAGAYVINLQSRFHYTNLNVGKGIDFEDYFKLEKIAMAKAKDGSKINLTWRSLKPQIVNRSIEITCVDESGKLLTQHQQKDMLPLKLNTDQQWTETIYIQADNNRNNWDKLGLRLSVLSPNQNCHLYRILSPRHNHTDWWNTRLLLTLNKEHL